MSARLRRVGGMALAGLLFASVARAALPQMSVSGGSWAPKKLDGIEVWANSPDAGLAIDTRGNSAYSHLTVGWDNLIVGTFLATPEGVVLTSARDRKEMSAQLTLQPDEFQAWRLHPNVEGAYRFAVLADTENPEAGQRIFGQLSKLMAQHHVQFAMHLGNAVSHGNPKQMNIFREQLRSFPFPTYVLPGDEDLTRGGRADWERLFGKVPLSFKIAKDRFLLVDNAFGTLTRAQHGWLEGALQQANDENARHIFVFMHRPPIDPRPGLNQGMLNRMEVRNLLATFVRHRVNTVFAGHLNLYSSERHDGLTLVTTGGGGAPIAPKAGTGGYHHFVEVEVNGASVVMVPERLP